MRVDAIATNPVVRRLQVMKQTESTSRTQKDMTRIPGGSWAGRTVFPPGREVLDHTRKAHGSVRPRQALSRSWKENPQ